MFARKMGSKLQGLAAAGATGLPFSLIWEPSDTVLGSRLGTVVG